MFNLKSIAGAFTGSVAKVSGKKDFLEAVCAAAALIAVADGEIEDDEVKATTKAIVANKALAGFDSRTIEATAQSMFDRASQGRVGKVGLWKEIDDVSSDADMCEAVYVTALDISESDGEIEPAEKAILDKLAQTLKIDPKKYDV